MLWNKPLAGARPYWGHPHTRNLVHAFLFNERSGQMVNDCASGVKGFFRNGSPSWRSQMGIAFDGSSDIGNFTGPVFASGTGPYTIISRVRHGGFAAFGTIWADGSTGLYFNGGVLQLFPGTATDNFGVNNGQYTVGFSTQPDAGYYMVNGQFKNTKGTYTAITANSTIGGGGGSFFLGDIAFIYIYKGYMTPSEMVSVQVDPYAMFTSPRAWRSIASAALVGGDFDYLLVNP